MDEILTERETLSCICWTLKKSKEASNRITTRFGASCYYATVENGIIPYLSIGDYRQNKKN